MRREDAHLLDDNALGVGSTTKGVSLEGCSQMGLLVAEIIPLLLAAVIPQVTTGPDSTRLSHLDGRAAVPGGREGEREAGVFSDGKNGDLQRKRTAG